MSHYFWLAQTGIAEQTPWGAKMENPYTKLPEKSFWKTAVANRNMNEIEGLWSPKFRISKHSRIATFGSCFAQHFGKALRERNFSWMNGEPAIAGLSDENAQRFNYNQFSCRTANIYTTSLLVQWLSWALGKRKPPLEYWESDGRIFDPFRPRIEPNGFETIEEMRRSRQVTISSLANIIKTADVFVFTLGLTESWVNAREGFEYPMCPGTVAGDFDDQQHLFIAQSYETVVKNLKQAVSMLRKANPDIGVLLTVSPVPLTATNSGKHVLVATSASKAILRTATETVVSENSFVDYFPSFEIINSPYYTDSFFKRNLRQVEQRGVDLVMRNFFVGLGLDAVVKKVKQPPDEAQILENRLAEIACEEELLGTFSDKGENP